MMAKGLIALVLAPGGELCCADVHPSFVTLEEQAGRLVPTFDFQTPPDRLLEFVDTEPTTYIAIRFLFARQAPREGQAPPILNFG